MIESRAIALGCIADDLTGATDLANELANAGLRTVQLMAFAQPPPKGAEAVVVALKSRSVDAGKAVAMSLEAARWLQSQGCRRLYFKYCSTFDSTPLGNIGPVLEALAQELNETAVIACPAFPAGGRTVYRGHLFVGDSLLNESGMQHHPLNPMTDANLVRVLQAQMRAPVGLLTHAHVAAGRIADQVDRLKRDGIGAVIADAVDDADLESLGRYCAGRALSSGGSGLGGGVARALASEKAARASARLHAVPASRRAIIAGSCSAATRRQLGAALHAYDGFRIALARGETPLEVISRAKAWIDGRTASSPIVLYSTGSPEEVAAQRAAWGEGVSEALEHILAEMAAHLVGRGVGAMIVAGGETSGAVAGRLGVERLDIGPEIDPGVPWTLGRGATGAPILLALKSGNFGADDFMTRAWDLLP